MRHEPTAISILATGEKASVTYWGAQLAETAEGKTTFESVFAASPKRPLRGCRAGEMLVDPPLESRQEYIVKPGPKERSAMKIKFSATFAAQNATCGMSINAAEVVQSQIVKKLCCCFRFLDHTLSK